MWARDGWSPARDGEAGSALMLVPAGFLILVLLAVLSVDVAMSYLGRRELFDMAAAAANDAAVVGIDQDEYYRCGRVQLDRDVARKAVAESLARRSVSEDLVDLVGAPQVGFEQDPASGEWRTTVTIAGRVDLLFSPGVDGPGTRDVRGSATVAAREGLPDPDAAGALAPLPVVPGPALPPAEVPGSADLLPPIYGETATPFVPETGTATGPTSPPPPPPAPC